MCILKSRCVFRHTLWRCKNIFRIHLLYRYAYFCNFFISFPSMESLNLIYSSLLDQHLKSTAMKFNPTLIRVRQIYGCYNKDRE